MIYLVIALIILGIVVSLSYGLNRPKRKWKESSDGRQYQYFITFLLSLLAVFIGAFLAFQLSDLQTENKEKNDLLDLMSRTVVELDDESTTMTMFYDYYKGKSVEEAERRMNANSIRDVFSLNILLNNQAFSKYVTPGDIMFIQQFVRQKEKIRDFMNNPSYELDDRINAYETYGKILQDIRLIVSLESDYVDGKISYKELLEQLNNANFVDTEEVPFIKDDRPYGTTIPLPARP